MIKLSLGNKKTGQGLFIFNLPAQQTCPNATDMCKKKCYTMKAQRMYKATRDQRTNNLTESIKESFVDDMSTILGNNKFITYFRIHESGDFYNQDYLNKWIAIAKKSPHVKFLAFTKSKLDYSKAPKNLKILFSMFPDTKEEDIVQGLPRAYAGKDSCPKLAFVCEGKCSSCGHCWTIKKNQRVYFEMH